MLEHRFKGDLAGEEEIIALGPGHQGRLRGRKFEQLASLAQAEEQGIPDPRVANQAKLPAAIHKPGIQIGIGNHSIE